MVNDASVRRSHSELLSAVTILSGRERAAITWNSARDGKAIGFCGRSSIDERSQEVYLWAVPRSSHPLLRSIGLTIRVRRRARGLSQESLADLADIDRSYMSAVERGLRNVSILNMARVARALGVPLWELLRPRRAGAVRDVPPESPEAVASEASEMLVHDQTEVMGDYDPLCAPGSVPGSTATVWEPRYLSLG
jgi:transcriptional regulator with XRE-family HTH domain